MLFFLTYLLANHRSTYPYTSGFDEHTHLSYVQYAHDFVIPADGYSMNTWAKEAFSCHPHAIFGKMTEVKCGDVLQGYGYPTGGSNTSQTWPPIAFLAIGQAMRIYEPFIEDPLFAARAGAALLWSFGVGLIGYSLIRRQLPASLALFSGLLMTALPVSANYSSFVSPYALTPLLVGAFLLVTERQVGVLRHEHESMSISRAFAFLLLSIVAVFTIPHFIIGISIFALAICFSELRGFQVKTKSIDLRFVFSLIFPLLAVFLGKIAFDLWPRIQALRVVPYPDDVRVSMGNVDPPEIIYQSISSMIQDRFFSFWPNGLSMGYPGSGTLFLLVSFWIMLLAGISYLNSLGMLRNGRWGPLGLALVLSAISFSVAFDIQMATPPPVRYGFTVVVIGCLLLADERLIRSKSLAMWSVGCLISVTYALSFNVPPLYTEAGRCEIGVDKLIECEPIEGNVKLPWP
jgi:hypothetical protein